MNTAASAFALAFAASCSPARLGPGYPLYPDPQVRRPEGSVARLVGPIGSVDGRDVPAQTDVFDLLPGCHVVQLNGDMARGNNYVAWMGTTPRFVFALRMTAGHTVVIRREIVPDMSSTTGRVVVIAQDQEPAGASTDLSPIQSGDDIRACKEWESRGE